MTAIATLNKVKEFKVTSERRYVVHGSNGKGFFQWLSGQLISISPAFFPPLIAVFLLKFMGYIDFHSVFKYAAPFGPVSIISSLYLDSIPEVVKMLVWLFLTLIIRRARILCCFLFLSFHFHLQNQVLSIRNTGFRVIIQSLIRGFFGYPLYTIFFILLGILFFWDKC